MQVDYYDLGEIAQSEHLHYCCRLAAHAWRSEGKPLLLQADDSNRREQLDELLWGFAPGAFVPHARYGDATAEQAPILLVDAQQSAELAGAAYPLLLNMDAELIAQANQCDRVLWVLPQEPQLRELVREYYKQARNSNIQQRYHNLGDQHGK